MWSWHQGWGWGGWLVMTLMMVAFWGLVIGFAVNVTRRSSGNVRGPDETPREILERRLARGEIDEQEYRRRVEVLSGSRTDTTSNAPTR